MKMPKKTSENYAGDETTDIDKEGDEVVNSYTTLFLAHSNFGFDSWLVLKSRERETTDMKALGTATDLISFSFRFVVSK